MRRDAAASPDEPLLEASPFISPMFWPTRTTPTAKLQRLRGFRTDARRPALARGKPDRGDLRGANAARPFTEKQIELVTIFADQAVIAIENARLFDEVQPRTRELSRSAGSADRDLGGAAGHLAARPASWSPYSRPCWRTRPAFARPSLAFCCSAKASVSQRRLAQRAARVCRTGATQPVVRQSRARISARRQTKAGGPHRRHHDAAVLYRARSVVATSS